MKRTITLFMGLFLSAFAFGQTDVLLERWTFANDNLTDTLVEYASDLNLEATMGTMGGTSAISMKNGASTMAAQAQGWDNGMNNKAWRIVLNSTGYENIKLSSKQQSGGSDAGPRDFKVQVKIGDAGTWTDISAGNYEVANDWTTGALTNKQLPAICNNQPLVYIRWVLRSNFDINGNTLTSLGKTKIDDILVTGDVATGVGEISHDMVLVYPNPSVGNLHIESKNLIQRLEILNNNGMKVSEIQVNNFNCLLQTELSAGLYNLVIYFDDQHLPVCKRIVIE